MNARIAEMGGASAVAVRGVFEAHLPGCRLRFDGEVVRVVWSGMEKFLKISPDAELAHCDAHSMCARMLRTLKRLEIEL